MAGGDADCGWAVDDHDEDDDEVCVIHTAARYFTPRPDDEDEDSESEEEEEEEKDKEALLGLCSAVASRRMNVWANDILTCFDTEALEYLLGSDFLVAKSEEALLDAILEFARDDNGFTNDWHCCKANEIYTGV